MGGAWKRTTNKVITDGKNAILAEPKDPDSLASGIEKLIKNPELRDSISMECKITAQDYSMPVYIKKLEKYFTEQYGNK